MFDPHETFQQMILGSILCLSNLKTFGILLNGETHFRLETSEFRENLWRVNLK